MSSGACPATTQNEITTKDVARILKVNPEIIAFLRKKEGLPFFKRKKYILYNEAEILRWRNSRLAADSQVVVNLPWYYMQIGLNKFCTYEQFKAAMEEKVFMDGDNVVQYLKRQNIWRDVKDVVGDIVTKYHNSSLPRCSCGRVIYTELSTKFCHVCRRG